MRNKEKKEEGVLGKSIIAVGYVAFILMWWTGILWVDIFNDMILVFVIMATFLFMDSVVGIIRRINGGHADYMSEEEIAERKKRRNIVNWIRFAIVTIIAGYIAYNFIVSFVMRGYFEKAMFVFVAFTLMVFGYIDKKIRGKVSKVQYKLCVAGIVVVIGIVFVVGVKNAEGKLYITESQRRDSIEEVKYLITTEDMGIKNEKDFYIYRKEKSFLADEFYHYIEYTKEWDTMLVKYIDLRSESFIPLYMKSTLVRERRRYSDLKEYETDDKYSIHYIEGNFDYLAFVTFEDEVLLLRWSFGDIEDGVRALDERMRVLLD